MLANYDVIVVFPIYGQFRLFIFISSLRKVLVLIFLKKENRKKCNNYF